MFFLNKLFEFSFLTSLYLCFLAVVVSFWWFLVFFWEQRGSFLGNEASLEKLSEF